MNKLLLIALAALAATGAAPVLAQSGGKAIYDEYCAGCHAVGVIGSPKPGDVPDWTARLGKGRDAVYRNAINGTPRGMPPRGGQAQLSDAQIRAAVDFMIGKAGSAAKSAAAPGKATAAAAAAPETDKPAAGGAQGSSIYAQACAGCHAAGVMGAPKPGDADAWKARLARGKDALYRSAVQGTQKGMPPKGGRADLSDAAVKAAVDHMLGGATVAAVEPSRPASRPEPPAPKQAEPAPSRQADAAPPRSNASVPVTAATAGQASPLAAAAVRAAAPTAPPIDASDVNSFNRLLKPSSAYNRPAAESGIHDPTNEATMTLQPPARAFATLPKSVAGNRVDWVKALEGKGIEPRWDRDDPKAAAVVMDMNIVREVKGTMPDVVYPHRQHTEWLDCANCHPAIFKPQKGANPISMASILLGQQCGVCHGKVAFPISECRLCHSKKKDAVAAQRK